MNKGLDLIKRQQPEIIDGFPTGNIYIGVTKEELTELEKELKALEIIKKKNVDTRDLFVIFEWFGRGEEKKALNDYNSRHKTDEEYNDITLTQEEYDLLKEVLL